MPLVPMNEMLADARQKQYAVGCYNAINLDMVRGVMEAAEAERSPVILCHAEVHFQYTPLEMAAPILVQAAERATVPTALLLDHGEDFGAIVRAMKLGLNAIMFDGSSLPYADNAAAAKEIVRIADALGVSVEAELGHVTRPRSAGADGDEDDSVVDDTSLYTDPEQARRFVEETGVHALAVAFGTAHGVYLKKPQLDLQRLQAIADSSPVPLVMHGGSGLTAEDFRQAIDHGISKINYYTGMAVYAAERLKRRLNETDDRSFYHHLMMESIAAIREDVQQSMRLFGSSGKA